MILHRLSVVAMVTAILPTLFFERVESAVCAPGVIQLAVSSAADAQELVEALNCTGGGVFEVTWGGTVVISEGFKVSGGSDVTITGSSGVVGTLDDDNAAVIDAAGKSRMFVVSDANLSLHNLVLQGGNTTENGGAIRVDSASSLDKAVVNVYGCAFRDNTATSLGESRKAPVREAW